MVCHVGRQVLNLIWNDHALRVLNPNQAAEPNEFNHLNFRLSQIQLDQYIFET